MRYRWLPLAVILLDILSKLALVNSPWPGGMRIIVEGFSVTSVIGGIDDIVYFSGDFNSSNFMLLGGLLGVFLMLLRTATGFMNIFILTAIGVQLTIGGIIAQVIDIIIHGEAIKPIIIDLFIPFSISISDLSIAAGLCLLLYDLIHRHLIPSASLIPLQASKIKPLALSEAVIGIDNVHSDVFISSKFRNAVHAVIHNFLNQTINKGRVNAFKTSTPYSHILKTLHNEYYDLVSTSIKRYKQDKDQVQFRLLYVSVIKLIDEEIKSAFDHFNHKLKHNPNLNKVSYIKDGAVPATFLLSTHSNTRYLVAKEVYSQLELVETNHLRKFEQALMGDDSSNISDIYKVPLLCASSPLDDYVLCHHYLLLNHRNEELNSFFSLEKLIAKVLEHNLQSLTDNDCHIKTNIDVQELGNLGYQKILDQPSFLMEPHNITILLDVRWSENNLTKALAKNDKQKYQSFKKHLRFQRYQLALLQNELEKSGMIYNLVTLYKINRQFKTGERAYDQTFIQKLQGILFQTINKQVPNLNHYSRRKQLLKIGLTGKSLAEIKAQAKGDLSSFLLEFIKDFAAYRRDLQKTLFIQQAMNKVSLIKVAKDIQTSRSNSLLYQFLTTDEDNVQQKSLIVRHTILKADLRGSTRITEELTRRGLNAATHFSRNFFSPINKILAQYKAEKVFIEGDALILIFSESDDLTSEKLCVSYACGLAIDILRIVKRQNMMLEKYKLPVLELGIGIAFNNTPPRFLFDEDSKITISPAINHADRLSSCAWAIKNWMKGSSEAMIHVKVFEPSKNAINLGIKAEKKMVYNINGILLEHSSFIKLFKETSFKRLKNTLPSIKDSQLFVGQFPDANGTMKTIIIRSAPIQVYDPGYKHTVAPTTGNTRYYEVIHDKQLIGALGGRTS